MGVVAQQFLRQTPPMAVVRPLASFPCSSFLPPWEVDGPGGEGSLPQIGAFDPFLGGVVFEGVGEAGQPFE